MVRSISEQSAVLESNGHQVGPEGLDVAGPPTVVGQREGHGFGALGQVHQQAGEVGGLLGAETVPGLLTEAANGPLGSESPERR